ncbi:hypothetical protein [Aedoeadaptatus coxii]|uniref:hypothetical protein n=1 Tax=Aedoeadaptatus coxii TaxID=755172 RepID=UPI002AD551FE|nr:hypothetical protein [Peptoniphilus coxii]
MSTQYTVIKILSETEILVNYGAHEGAKNGDKLRIIVKGPEVTYNNKSFGTLDRIKECIEVTTIYEQFSICKKIIYTRQSILSPLAAIQSTSASIEPMNVDKTQIDTTLFAPEVTPIQVGDLVEKI